MKRIIRNIVGVMLLTIALVVTQIPVEVSEASNDTEDFQMDGTTLVKYTGTASTVSVPSSVEKVGEEAFAGNSYIESVKLPKKVEVISFGAFSQCPNLKKVNIPESVTTIETGAFANCTSLGSVKLGSKVNQLGNGVFAGCTTLKKVSIDKKNTSFICEKGVLYDADKKTLYQYFPGKSETTFTIPESVETIKEYAFWGSENLEEVKLNPNLSRIPSYAFSNCKALKDVFISYAVKAIDSKAFEDCIGLTALTIPPSVSTIHDTAFDGCYNLTLSAEKDTKAEAYALAFNAKEKPQQAEYEDILGNISEPEDVTKETVSDNNSQSKDQGKLIGSSKIVGNQAFIMIDNSSDYVKDGSLSSGPSAQKEVIVNGPQEELNDGQGTDSTSTEKGLSIPKYTITDDGIIADQSFYKQKDLTEYSIPEGTKEIGEFAFARTGLTSIVIPEGVTTIGYGAFYHCDNLNQVTFPSTIVNVEPVAFAKTGFIENWKKSGSNPFLTVGDGVLIAYQGTGASINIPDGVKMIAPEVFKDNQEVTSLFLPDSVVTIGEGAFENCTNLSQVAGGTNLKSIEDRAFAGCPLTTIRIPNAVENIGLRAYDYTGLNLTADEKVAVFHGAIPKLSYEKTAQRLSNKEYRNIALNQVPFAVINKDISLESLEGTVLDNQVTGFKGIIVSIDSESAMTATVRGTTLTGEELAYFELPKTIEVYERQYELKGTEELEAMSKENTSVVYENQGSVLIKNKVKALDVNQMSADFSGEEGAYILCVSENPEGAAKLNEAYYSIYQTQLPANLKVFDFSFYEEANEINIQKLGKEHVRITIPLLESLSTGTLRILTMDANGQLEEVPFELSAEGQSISFNVSHFSDFGFYTSGQSIYGESAVKNGKAAVTTFTTKDESPDTGDVSIHPKWFFAIGLLCTACAVVFYRKKEKIY